MKEDNISHSAHHDVPFCDHQYARESCCIFFFKFKSFNQFNPPRTAPNFRHLLNCRTMGLILSNFYSKVTFVLLPQNHASTMLCSTLGFQ